MGNPANAPRSGIRELLSLLASEEGQLAYERDVPIANVPAELVCMWFNDTYHPDSGWQAHFTDRELEAMARFHALYDHLRKRLPRDDGTIRTWLASPVWRGIKTAAVATLAEIPEQAGDDEDAEGRAIGEV